jgi:hypothetical protein
MYWLLFIACLALILFPVFLAFKKKNFWLNHNDLTKQPLFWVGIFWPAGFSLALGSRVWLNRTLDFSYDGYEAFIQISKLPLAVLALTIPVTAVIAAIHRSIQTAKQIEETQVKNTADLYYSHKKHYIEILEKISFITQPHLAYKIAFPNNSEKNYNIELDKKFLQDTKKLNDNLIQLTTELYENNQITNQDIEKILKKIKETHCHFFDYIDYKYKKDPNIEIFIEQYLKELGLYTSIFI